MRTDDITSDIRDQWAQAVDCEYLSTDERYTDRFFGVLPEVVGQSVVIVLRPVGPEYAAAYRGWVTLNRVQYQAAFSERPRGYRVIYAMVGLAPDGRVWWSALFDEAALDVGEAESVLGDRFYRLRPDQAAGALIAEFDHLQLALPLEQDTLWAPPAPPTKAIEAPIGASITMRGKVIKHNAGGSVTVDFGSVKWAIVGVTPVTIEA